MTLAAAAVLRLGPESVDPRRAAMLLPIVWVVQYLAGAHFGLYRGRWVFGSIEEVAALGRTVAVAGTVLFVADAAFIRNRPLPLSAVVAGTMGAFLIMGAIRYWWRIEHDRSLRPTLAGRTRVIVFGAGDGGQRAVRAMLRDPESIYVPVAMLDDAPRMLHLRFMGLRVVGTRADMEDVARKFDARALVVAVPSLTGPQLRGLVELAVLAGLEVRVLPSVRELLDGEVRVVDIREPDEHDLLGRHHIETDLDAVAAYLSGKRVLVTGAGGSIGSELCRQIAAFGPGELLMVDRDESALHAVQLSIRGRALLNTPDLLLVDIRDRARVRRLFEERRPEIVFHAAALKHLPLLESHPVEALKTNVWGSLAVLEAAQSVGVDCFVNISTDKAANPCSVLGYSKRIAEGLTASAHLDAPGRYLSVRFGNVLGSRGSVLTAFRSQMQAGGPLTVTHPEVTRFFMTVEESVQLVLQAAAIGCGGEVMVLDMGEPVRIADVARRMAAGVDPPCPIEFVGLRPGEKLHEELFGENELSNPSRHPLISKVDVPSIRGDEVRHLDPTVPASELVATFADLCMAMTIDLLPAVIERWEHPVGGD